MMERKSLVFKAAYIYKKKQAAHRTTHTHTHHKIKQNSKKEHSWNIEIFQRCIDWGRLSNFCVDF